MAEEIPTGTFGHPRPHTSPWSPQEQAQHRAELLAALNSWQDPSKHATRDRNRHRTHLRLIQPNQTPDAA
ncbi:hypothetical protein ACFWR9_41755 [Streptomyces sp. NPDC058534]|uniref:hypothetical protein n=1 Tax=Streptomyces sp. NPDC058534 TaxID=3346541 RepID=UPI0036687853